MDAVAVAFRVAAEAGARRGEDPTELLGLAWEVAAGWDGRGSQLGFSRWCLSRRLADVDRSWRGRYRGGDLRPAPRALVEEPRGAELPDPLPLERLQRSLDAMEPRDAWIVWHRSQGALVRDMAARLGISERRYHQIEPRAFERFVRAWVLSA